MAINSGQSPSQNPSSKGPYDEWRKQWDKEAGRYAKTESSEHDAFFLSLFEKAYADSAQKRDRNKQWNIFTKKLFFYIILAGAVAQVALFIWTAKAFLSATASNPGTSGVTVGEIAALDALMLLTVMIILLSVNKWIGVEISGNMGQACLHRQPLRPGYAAVFARATHGRPLLFRT